MSDHSEIRAQILEDQLKKNAAVELMMRGAQAVLDGGVEGIQEAAKSCPELIITILVNMVQLVALQQEEIREHFEARLRLMDAIEEFRDSIPTE